jgi:hypothetical protein
MERPTLPCQYLSAGGRGPAITLDRVRVVVVAIQVGAGVFVFVDRYPRLPRR